MDLGHRTTQHCRSSSSSANTSPISASKRDTTSTVTVTSTFSYTANSFVRTSRSEDQLQMQKDSSISAVDIDIDDDITSSLNTLLDTGREDGGSSNGGVSSASDRIVWTYNAPVTAASEQHRICAHTLSNGGSSSSSSTASSSSPLRSGSPASPTSVSSSVSS